MNKKLFITTAVVGAIGLGGLFAGSASAKQAVHNSFKDERFYQCVVTAYNTLDGASKDYQTDILTDAELLKITSLDCSKGSSTADAEKIVYTDGLEKLANLTSLNLNSNQITAIDLSGNAKLTRLEIENNKLTSLDISNNKMLETVYIERAYQVGEDTNNVKELNIVNNPTIKSLYADDTMLISDIPLKKSGESYYMDLSKLKFITDGAVSVKADDNIKYNANNFIVSFVDIDKANHIELSENWGHGTNYMKLVVDKSGLAEEGKEDVPVPNTSGDAKTDAKTDSKTDTKTDTKATADTKEDAGKKSSVKSPDTGSLTNEDGANKLALIIATPIMAAAGVVATFVGKRVFRKKVGF